MSCVEVNHYEAIWLQRFDMMRSLSAVNALQMFSGRPLGHIRILRMDSETGSGYV